jgi:hypothetical protein
MIVSHSESSAGAGEYPRRRRLTVIRLSSSESPSRAASSGTKSSPEWAVIRCVERTIWTCAGR